MVICVDLISHSPIGIAIEREAALIVLSTGQFIKVEEKFMPFTINHKGRQYIVTGNNDIYIREYQAGHSSINDFAGAIFNVQNDHWEIEYNAVNHLAKGLKTTQIRFSVAVWDAPYPFDVALIMAEMHYRMRLKGI